MLDSGEISRVYRNKDRRKDFFTKTDVGGVEFYFNSSNRVDFRKNYSILFYFAVLNAIAHHTRWRKQFDSGQMNRVALTELRYVMLRVRVHRLVKPLHFLPFIHSFQSSRLFSIRDFFVCLFVSAEK